MNAHDSDSFGAYMIERATVHAATPVPPAAPPAPAPVATRLFTATDYATLAAIVFRDDYPGNATARGVVEAPNGDGNLDAQKRYSHVAVKYVAQCQAGPSEVWPCSSWELTVLLSYLERAHDRAMSVAHELGVPAAFMPSFEHGALRVLEYPPGACSAPHTDVGLLTLNLYRDQPDQLVTHNPGVGWNITGVPPYHLGRVAREIGIGPAAPHLVKPSNTTQHSIVYFAVPDHEAILPSGQRLGSWLDAEMAKMRSYK